MPTAGLCRCSARASGREIVNGRREPPPDAKAGVFGPLMPSIAPAALQCGRSCMQPWPWRFGRYWPKARPTQSNQSSTRLCICQARELQPIRFEAVFGFSALAPTKVFPSRDILNHQSAARPGPDRAQLRFRHRGADRRAGGRRCRPRPAGLGANRLRQDRRLRARHRQGPARRRRAVRAGHRAPGADRGPHPRTGLAGAARTRLALSICRCARGFLRRRHGSARRTAPAGRGRPHRGRHARPVCATICGAAASTSRS